MTNITTKLRTGDEVVVLAGRDIGKTGTLRKIIKSKNKGIVTGVNMVKKHTKPNPEMGVTGGIIEQESSIDCLLYTSPSPRDGLLSRMPSSA